ncbi:MAG TPA: hypothetical protein VE669_08615 [Actinomycetota bacterium]|nr:hypothetical protein [Actinomycetota bacterium]
MTLPVTLVPHTHWDREWYEPFPVFSARLEAMMDVLIRLGDEGFPHFHLDGQTAMVDDYLDRRPNQEPEIRRLAGAGKLSLGPWATQMDEFLVSGESLIRNLEMGLARSHELGAPLMVGYLPDQFGHVGQMPQILRMHGIERATVWRGVPQEVDRTSFRWRSPDGSEVVAEYLIFGYFNGAALERHADPAELAAEVGRSVDRLRPHLAGDRALVLVGYDHAGPDRTLPSRLEESRGAMPELEVRIGGLADHAEAQALPSDLPVWEGELRSSARAPLLPNVVSARVHQKRERGRVESLIERYTEPLAAQVPGFTWPEDRLRRAWTLLLWNGAHDSVCGCSHDQVALDVDARFAEAREIGGSLVEQALMTLGSRTRSGGVIRFNPSPFPREGVPGNGWAVVERVPEPALAPVATVRRHDVVDVDGIALRLLDERDVGDLYDFCPAEADQVPSPPAEIRIRGQKVQASWEGLRVEFRVSRRADEDLLRLEGSIHNERPDHRLRLHVGLAGPADRSLAGSPFELVERPPVGEGGDLEAASPTWPARHVAMAGGTGILHEGVFEYEVVDGRELAVTLLRCVGTISRPRLATRPFAAGPDVPTPLAQMLGETVFSLGIWPSAAVDEAWDRWERFALPLAEAPASGGGELPSEGTLLELEGDAVLSSIRRVDGRRQVRVWNPSKVSSAPARIGEATIVLPPARIETHRFP